MWRKLGVGMASTKNEQPNLFGIATTLGEIKATQAIILDQLSRGATKDHVIAIEQDVDNLATMIRENHSNHDGRLRALENVVPVLTREQNSQGATLGRALDAAFKILVAMAIVGLGAKQAGVF